MNGKWIAVIATALALSLASCTSNRTAVPVQVNPPQGPAQGRDQGWNIPEYRLQRGDEIEIKFFYNPDLNERLIIRPDGNISLQLIDELFVAELTPAQLDGILTRRYARELKQPELTVIVRSFVNQRVLVGGEVGKPQLVPLTARMTALQSVFKAGGLTDRAQPNSVIVIRKDAENRPFGIKVDLNQVMEGEEGARDIKLLPYDIVYVPKKAISKVNIWIDQYIRQNIPIHTGIGFSYELTNDDD
jgi:protein involved in polysaccharide export with SLBB domain